MRILTINGFSHVVDMPDDTPLLWVIRESLQMTGTKFGCGAGLCGACTVHLNGVAVRSCQTSLEEAAGQEITTIEGLDPWGSIRCNGLGSRSRFRNAVTASPVKLCRRPHCCRRIRTRPMPRLSGDERQSVPLHDLYSYQESHQARRYRDA